MDYWNFTPVSIIYLIAIGISLLITILSIRIRTIRGARSFALMMLGVIVWILGSMLNIFSSYEPVKYLMFKIEYIGMGCAVYFWLIFIAKYTHFDKWLSLSKIVYLFLAIVPVLTIIQVLRVPEVNYIRESYNFIYINGLKILEKNYNVGFYIWVAYAYTILLFGFVLIVIRILQIQASFRKQLFYLTPVVFIIIVPNIFLITENNPISPYDPTPLSLVLVGILILISMYFHNFLSVVPVAQDLILNNIKSGVIVIDVEEKVTEINPIAESIIGENNNNIIGERLSELLPEISCFIRQVPFANDIKTEVVLGEEKRNYELKIAPLKNSLEKVRGNVLMFWDITDQKMALSELDAYARTVAHNLKTPLGHIMGFAKLLRGFDITEVQRKEYQDNIVRGGEKMRSIIDGLLNLAKIRNQDKLEKSVINMQDILDSVMLRMNSTITKKRVKVTMPVTWPKVLGNSIWIEEVWINLLTNAIKYGGNPPIINFGVEPYNGHYKFWISDNGSGLTEKEQAMLFSEFSRLHPKRETIKGHGLGLSIVQRVINKLGGDTGVESIVGEGSTFYFTLKSASPI